MDSGVLSPPDGISFNILRVAVASNISGTVLTDYPLKDWTFNAEEKSTLARLFQTLVSIPKEFPNEELQQVSFNVESRSGARRVSNSETTGAPNLNLAIIMKRDVIVGVFYDVADESEIPKLYEYFHSLVKRIYSEFEADHMEYYESPKIKHELEKAFQESKDLSVESNTRFQGFAEKIKQILNC